MWKNSHEANWINYSMAMHAQIGLKFQEGAALIRPISSPTDT